MKFVKLSTMKVVLGHYVVPDSTDAEKLRKTVHDNAHHFGVTSPATSINVEWLDEADFFGEATMVKTGPWFLEKP